MYYQASQPYISIIQNDDYLSRLDIIEQRIEQNMLEEATLMYRETLKKFLITVSQEYTPYSDLKALEKLLYLIPKFISLSLKDNIFLNCARVRFHFINKEKATKNDHKFLILDDQININSIKQEVLRHESMWSINTTRQKSISYHKQTNTIVLYERGTPPLTSHIIQRNYAQKKTYADLYPSLIKWLNAFVDRKNGELGRVALVRLKPYSLVFRHFDDEQSLKGFDRYHVVINSPHGSFMSVDEEEVTFQEGDVFFFENKVIHSAYNPHNQYRIHLIIDIRVPKNNALSAPIYNYLDWKFFDPRNAQELSTYKL